MESPRQDQGQDSTLGSRTMTKLAVLLGSLLTLAACGSVDKFTVRQTRSGGPAFEAVIVNSAGTGQYPLGIASGKFASGHLLDVAVTSWGNLSSDSGSLAEGSLALLLGSDGNRKILAAKDEYAAGLGASGVVVADLNRDGKLDIALVATNGITGTGAQTSQPGQVWIYYGNGDGTFRPPQIERSPLAFPVSIVVADFDEDGYPDIAVGSPQARSVGFLWGGPKATWRQTTTAISGTAQVMALGHFTGRDVPEIAVLGRTDSRPEAGENLSIVTPDGSRS